MNKLHLGSGKKILPGFTNIDARKVSKEIHVDNVATLETVPDHSVELIYACHVLEHFGRHEYEDVLRCWFRKLQPRGVLRLSVPDIQKASGLYLSGEYTLEQMYGFMYGGQMHEYDYHKIGFDYQTLSNALVRVGFEAGSIKKWNWRETEHAHQDDFSQAYLPHMNKESGIVMSINLEATKR